MRVVLCYAGLAVIWLLPLGSVSASAGDQKEPKVIPADRAKDHLGEQCTVEMTVKASKNSERRRTYFLDSETDFHDPKDLAVVITYNDAEKFKKAGIHDPAEHFRGKTVRVTGKVIVEAEQVRIHVTEPEQVKLIGPATP